MAQQSKKDRSEKQALHPRNLHRAHYDFEQLGKACPELNTFVFTNAYGNASIDFADPQAVKTLNKALLKVFYGISDWDIPQGYLCPPIPGRTDYIHYAADLLASCNNGVVPSGSGIHVLDVGTGANCIYPLTRNALYGWSFTGSDVDPKAIASAERITAANGQLKGKINIRLQANKNNIFKGIIQAADRFDLSICNPPFHASREEAQAGTNRKQRNLGQKKGALNFGGQSNELWYTGGERAFITKMIAESVLFASQCNWFTSLVAKSASLESIYYALEKANAADVRTVKMAQGSKISRMIAWKF